MPQYEYPELNDLTQMPYDFARNVVREARNFACGLYQRYPRFMTGQTPFGDGPASPFTRGLYESMCGHDPTNLPSPPQSPLSGGQCECVAYRFEANVRVKRKNLATCEDEPDLVFTPEADIWGPVTGYYLKRGEPVGQVCGLDQGSLVLAVRCGGRIAGPCVPGTEVELSISGNVFLSLNHSVDSASVTRLDGLPDECGDAPPAYPDTGWPGPGDLSVTLPVPYINGDIAPIDVTIQEPSLTINNNVDIGSINIDIDVCLVLNLNVLTATLRAQRCFIGEGEEPSNPDSTQLLREIRKNREVTEDVGEVVNEVATDIGLLGNRVDELTEDVADLDEKATRIEDKVDDVDDQTEPPKTPDDPEVLEITREPGDTNREGVPDLQWVKIVLTEDPYGNKIQLTDRSDRSVVYAGWFEWLSDGAPLPRESIHFRESLFKAPRGTNGYSYWLTNGAQGYAVEYLSPDGVKL